MSIPHITAPTNKVFYEFPTTGGTTVLEYTGDNSFQPLSYNTTGTLAHTFVLPDLSQYKLTIGLRITFMNSSTQPITVNANDGSLVMSVESMLERYATVIGSGNTNASWSSVGPAGTGGVGIVLPLSIANGGTGYSYLQPNAIPNAIPAYDANAALRAKTFVGAVVDYTGASIVFTNSSLPDTVMIKAGGGSTSYTLPNESTAILGTRTRFINTSITDYLTILTLYGGVNVLPGGFIADYEFITDNTGGKAWVGYSRPLTNISAGIPLSLDASYTYGSTVINVPSNSTPVGYSPASYFAYNNASTWDIGMLDPLYWLNQPAPFNYHMDRNSSKTIVVNNWYADADLSTGPAIFLPDVTTIPVGFEVKFYFQNPFGGVGITVLGNVNNLRNVGTGEPVTMIPLYQFGTPANNVKMTLLSNDPGLGKAGWNISTGSSIPGVFDALLGVITTTVEMLPFLIGVGGGLLKKIKTPVTAPSTTTVYLGKNSGYLKNTKNTMINDSGYPMRVEAGLQGDSNLIGEIDPHAAMQLGRLGDVITENAANNWALFAV